MRIKSILVFIFCTWATTVSAQVKVGDNGKVSGLVFSDYYWIPSNHNSDLEGNNGFWIRRIYFTYDQKISDSFSTRFRLEMNSKGDFDTEVKLSPHVKDAYLKWKHGHQQILAGVSATPTYSFIRSVWGYRSVEKSPLNLQKMASARDLGLSFKGKLGGREKWRYFFMFANGNGNRTELDKGKKFMLSLAYKLTDRLTIEAYGDWNNNPNGKDINTIQGFLAYQAKSLHVGALFAHQVQQNALADRDLDLNIASIFTNFQITGKVRGLLRADHLFEANPSGEGIDYIPFSNQTESTLLIGGTDIALDSSVHFIPNIETVVYGVTPAGTAPTTDVIPRLTLYYTF